MGVPLVVVEDDMGSGGGGGSRWKWDGMSDLISATVTWKGAGSRRRRVGGEWCKWSCSGTTQS